MQEEVDAVLADYEYRSLTSPDIAEILSNNNIRKIEGNTLLLYESIHGKLLLAHMERPGGNKILVKPEVPAKPMPIVVHSGLCRG
jgi:hypothetical protein